MDRTFLQRVVLHTLYQYQFDESEKRIREAPCSSECHNKDILVTEVRFSIGRAQKCYDFTLSQYQSPNLGNIQWVLSIN